MDFDSLYSPYASQRMTSYARNGMVATSQPLAAQAGLDMLKKGGNAIDAAIATAASLTVLEPTSNGIGGDAFALVWVKDTLYGLNASGRSPGSISIEAVKSKGHTEMPQRGWFPVTVPGTPGAWAELSKRFGKLPFEQLLQPAIQYAEKGYPISPILGKYWNQAAHSYLKEVKGEEFSAWFETFTQDGKAPAVGQIWSSSDHAKTLQSIAETKAESFYRGEIAEKIDYYSRKQGGFLRKEDLEVYHPEWVDPIHVNYRGYDVWEIPPNGQGLTTLMALNNLKAYEFTERDTVETFHKQIEAMKLAFTDGQHYITDPENMKVSVEELLSDEYANKRRKLIGQQALTPTHGAPPTGGTVYLAAADGEGNMVSFIQSNYKGFGSGIVVPGTGIALHNRGRDFSLDPNHSNSLAPGKKTYHTIIPGFLSKGNQPVGPFGVMGGFMQPQGHLQVVMNTIDFGLNPQATLDAPRWLWLNNKTVMVESHFPNHLAQALQRKGHDIIIATDENGFGRGQIIWRDPETQVLAGGTEPRTDGQVASW
jgi:gamma-glutamyltranspeptidase/glutathione hydrolase